MRELKRHDIESRRRGGKTAGSNLGRVNRDIPPMPVLTQCIGCGFSGKPPAMHRVGDRYQRHYLCPACWKETL